MTATLPHHLRGIQVWAPSFCRSTLGFYEALAQAFEVPLRVCLARNGIGARGDIGLTLDEFDHLDLIEAETEAASARALSQHLDWLQIFGIYQTVSHFRATLGRAIRAGAVVGIASEAPCNMEPPGIRRALKAVYLNRLLPRRVAQSIEGAGFILNWSGDDAKSLQALGWPRDKIIPLGYFPPPLPGTTFRARDRASHTPFRILCSGALTWHRGPDLLIDALALLKDWGVDFEASFTGTGPLEATMRARARAAKLPVRFHGRVPLDDLVALYEGCSVFVAPGRQEPWGIRVNDALNAGAPVVVSRGMGAAKLVDDHGVGASFMAGDASDLAWNLRRLATDPACYLSVCDALSATRKALLPRAAAARVAPLLSTLLTADNAR